MFKSYLHLMLAFTLNGIEQSTAAERERNLIMFLIFINNEKHQMYKSQKSLQT